MTLASDIAAIDADESLLPEHKRILKYDIKGLALVDVILNGKPAPNPVPPLLNRTFTANGMDITITAAQQVTGPHFETFMNGGAFGSHQVVDAGGHALVLRMLLMRGRSLIRHPTRDVTVITNPPVIPRAPTGNEKQDLITAAVEILEGFN
jgi:hypothetical protein